MNTMNNFITVFFILIALAFAAPTPIVDAAKDLDAAKLLAKVQDTINLGQKNNASPTDILGTIFGLIFGALGNLPIFSLFGNLFGGLGS